MTEENGDRKRRLLMMLTIVLAGSAITFIDLSPAIAILIALGVGIVMLFALQMVTFDELKIGFSNLKDKLNQPISIKKDKSKESASKDTPAIKTEKPEIKDKKAGKKREIPFASYLQKIPFIKDKIGTKSSDINKPEKKDDKTDDKRKDDSSKKSLFPTFSSAFGFLKGKTEKKDKAKKIDELLDKTVKGEFPSELSETEDIQGGESIDSSEEDEFSDFDDLDLGLEEDEDISVENSDSKPAGFEEEIPESTIADILLKEGIELELDDEEFPAADSQNEDEETTDSDVSSSGLSEFDELDDDVSGLDLDDEELDEFDDIDLDEIETEDEIDLGEEEETEEIEIGVSDEEMPEPVEPEEDIISAPPKEWTQTRQTSVSSDDDNLYETPMSLALGGGDDDDLFAMLKSDTKKAVSVQELSLVRDLKDIKVESEELVDELEDILVQFGIEKEIKKDINENNNEANINKQNQ